MYIKPIGFTMNTLLLLNQLNCPKNFDMNFLIYFILIGSICIVQNQRIFSRKANSKYKSRLSNKNAFIDGFKPDFIPFRPRYGKFEEVKFSASGSPNYYNNGNRDNNNSENFNLNNGKNGRNNYSNARKETNDYNNGQNGNNEENGKINGQNRKKNGYTNGQNGYYNGNVQIPDEIRNKNRNGKIERYNQNGESPLLTEIEGLSVFGKPGDDFPIYYQVPETEFTCSNQLYPGYYADTATRCQIFHVCHQDGRQYSFICPNATVFSQKNFVCAWWYDVACEKAPEYYDLNQYLYEELDNSDTKAE